VGIQQVGGGVVGDESSRVGGNYKWVQLNMDKCISRGMQAVVIFAHASMGSERLTYFGSPFMSLLKTTAYSRIKALYIHGDGHEVNRRGGLYSRVCQAGNIDKTWSSNYGY